MPTLNLRVVALALGLFVPAYCLVDKWTPASFDWNQIPVGPPETWKGLYQNLSNPNVAVNKEVMRMGRVDLTQTSDQVLALPFALGLVWQAFNLALVGGGLYGTITGCIQNEGKAENLYKCVNGLISTIVGIGGSASALKKLSDSRGWFGVAANAWDNSGLELITLTRFDKRDYVDDTEETAQKSHNFIVYDAIRHFSRDLEPEFLGYAPDHHRLAKRDSEVHPFAPMFRFTHPRHGPVEVVSRDLGDSGIFFTIGYEGHPTHTKRDEFFQHERVDSNLVEGRFDSSASKADPGDIQFDAAGAFDQIERVIECYTQDEWKNGSVLSAQMYDNANKATFAFASIGIFPDDSVDGDLKDFEPAGQPLTGGMECN